jgi:ABC-2 type transport system permease protein
MSERFARLTAPGQALVDDLRLYRRLIGARLRAQLQYRSSFWLMTLVGFVATGSELLATWLLFGRFEQLAGWRFGEVALLYGLASVAFGLNEMIGAGFDIFPTTLQQGEFDRLLTRPSGIFIQVLANDFQLRRLGRIGQGVLALGLAIASTPIAWTPAKLAILGLAIICGIVMYGALMVLGAVLCFWTIQSIEIINTVTYGGVEATSYPLDIYHVGLQRLFTFVIPLAFISYVPALAVLDRLEAAGLPIWLPLLTPLAAGGLAGLALVAWQFGLRHYQSTGS